MQRVYPGGERYHDTVAARQGLAAVRGVPISGMKQYVADWLSSEAGCMG